MPEVHTRKARPADVQPMLEMINSYARTGLMLPRTEFEMCENIRDFSIALVRQPTMPVSPPEQMPEAQTPTATEQVVGCGALHFYTPQMAELRSLAVAEKITVSGIGRKIVEALLQEARDYGLDVVFAFTYVVPFFEKCGFRVVDRGSLPLKVWKDCVRCPHFNCCDEVAMVCPLSPEACVEDSGGSSDGLIHLSSRITRWPDASDEVIQIPRVASPGFQAR